MSVKGKALAYSVPPSKGTHDGPLLPVTASLPAGVQTSASFSTGSHSLSFLTALIFHAIFNSISSVLLFFDVPLWLSLGFSCNGESILRHLFVIFHTFLKKLSASTSILEFRSATYYKPHKLLIALCHLLTQRRALLCHIMGLVVKWPVTHP